jgi:hypothetical protein
LVLKVKETLPLASVVTLFSPRKVRPSSVPEGFEKNWRVNVELGVLSNWPATLVPLLLILAEESTGMV